MLTCVPTNFCSWDYLVRGGEHDAILTFDWFTEQGTILHGGNEYRVNKHGPLSGRWTLERGGETALEANKPNAFFRTFEISTRAGLLTLRAVSAMRRGFEIVAADGVIAGTIEPMHAFTRRAYIDCDNRVPELIQLFAFWLVALAWRRAKNNSGAS